MLYGYAESGAQSVCEHARIFSQLVLLVVVLLVIAVHSYAERVDNIGRVRTL